MKDKPRFKVKTVVSDNGDISQEILLSTLEMNKIIKKIIRTSDESIREALIHLGWTPPEREDSLGNLYHLGEYP